MSRLEAWFVHLATLLVGGTGLVYAWMRYFARSDDPFAVVGHPWQPATQHLHVVAAPLLVFAIGLLWKAHAWAGLRLRVAARWASGVSLLATAGPMIVSGYLLQTAAAPGWRKVWLAVHLTASALWTGGYLIHQISSRWRPGSASPGWTALPPRRER